MAALFINNSLTWRAVESISFEIKDAFEIFIVELLLSKCKNVIISCFQKADVNTFVQSIETLFMSVCNKKSVFLIGDFNFESSYK